ncbi:MAG: prolyl oligopeptidase family serine peptidase [Gammaproteobacteria bacterium]|nr:prolyl oligopeptidase family serine peptidase [Gammaproteobacteria bacterium]
MGVIVAATARGQEPEQLISTPLAEVFGAAPLVRGPRLSPDGQLVSQLQRNDRGIEIVTVLDTRTGDITTVMAGNPDEYRVDWCDWVDNDRVICGLHAPTLRRGGIVSSYSRLFSVAADGTDPTLIFEGMPSLRRAQFHDRVIDWLPDEPKHVLLAFRVVPVYLDPFTMLGGARAVRLNVYDSSVEALETDRNDATVWITDGHGTPRLRAIHTYTHRIWEVFEPEGYWDDLHRTRLTDLDDQFTPIAFDRDANEVLFFDLHEGRRALLALELDNDRARRVVYAHPRVDVTDVVRLGRHDRIVGVMTMEERPEFHFFDPETERVYARLEDEFPGMAISIVDADWDERRFLIFVKGERDPGSYYLFDTESPELLRLANEYPALDERELAERQPVEYESADGTPIRGVLTLPTDGATGAGVVLPNGGPIARNYWAFDYLTQYLAARGIAVLQSDYRGSIGYGGDWSGASGFRDWPLAVDDVAAGARYLVDAGHAESGRICLVGWDVGGYVSLLSAIEQERLYRCVVSIAGVTDPTLLAQNALAFVGGRRADAAIGYGGSVRRRGSPMRRADELRLPVLLIHSRDDIEFPFSQSAELHDALLEEGGQVQLIEYARAGHDIAPPHYRTDMLARVGAFLDTYIGMPVIDFFSRVAPPADPVELIHFGEDAERLDGNCADARFTAADGGVLRTTSGRVWDTHNDATDCRRDYARGEIVLRDSVASNHAGQMPVEDRATFFIEPAQQLEFGFVTLDDEEIERRPGVPIVYAVPGFRVLGVLADGLDYACVVDFDLADPDAEPVYRPASATRDSRATRVRIPAFAGAFYRIDAAVENETLSVRVTDVAQDRVVVDQRAAATGGCSG